jgi:ubiquinone/menaquinone biosynthesis C-methylase UbiE
MPGVSFDRAADYYDATRGYPPGVDNQVRDGIVRQAGLAPSARLLELGVGTGRIALPFIRAGYEYTGVDISREMMTRLRTKLAASHDAGMRYRLVGGDVMRVPLASATFDAVVMVHVLHLVDDWRAVLDEARRLLRPGAPLVLADDNHIVATPPTPPEQVFHAWSAILDDLGVPPEQRRARAVRGLDEQFVTYLRATGASVEHLNLVEYTDEPHTARETVAGYRERIFSSCWFIPDEVHAEVSDRLDRWLNEECSDPDTPYGRAVRVEALIVRFPS